MNGNYEDTYMSVALVYITQVNVRNDIQMNINVEKIAISHFVGPLLILTSSASCKNNFKGIRNDISFTPNTTFTIGDTFIQLEYVVS